MEEVNTKEQGPGSEQEAQEILEEEVSLNVEQPADASSLDSLAQEQGESFPQGDDAPIDVDYDIDDDIGDDIGADVDSNVPDESGTQEGPSQTEATSEDALGISVEDDELWEEDETEEIPLFEDELLDEISQEEEKEQAAQEAGGAAAGDEGSASQGDPEGAVAQEASSDEDDSKSRPEHEGPDNEGDEAGEAAPQEAQAPEPSLLMRLVPWIITGVSSCLLVAGIFTFWMLWKGAVSAKPENPQPTPAKTEAPAKNVAKPVAQTEKKVTAHGFEALDLAPFIIPGKSGGELVFFKLEVELVVPDASTKQKLIRRQAWLRDIIYQELKGLDISSGVKGDILERYRVPLLKRLNKEFAPLKIEDIRLMGYLLR
ncbi:MAG: flagellar basal body-associated FliL family protein [Thermodesulfobacteria bacterium]|nr:flagellar basal body-associated FliL family protein [Thermodesulfobacteriota bacterium]